MHLKRVLDELQNKCVQVDELGVKTGADMQVVTRWQQLLLLCHQAVAYPVGGASWPPSFVEKINK